MAELTLLEKRMKKQGIAPVSEGITVNEDLRLIDQDTGVNSDGKTMRVSGIDAPETAHLDPYTLKMSSFDVGGETATLLGARAIENEEFDTPVYTGKKGFFGRDMGDYVNKEGEAYSKYLLATGASDLSKYANSDDVNTVAVGGLERRQRAATGGLTDWDRQVANHQKHMLNGGISVKPLAVDEATFAQAPEFYSGVMNRRYDRTETNMTKSWQLGEALSVGVNSGWLGVSTAAGMVGEALDIDSLSHFGYSNARAIKREMEDAPYLRDMAAFDENGDFTLDGISEVTNYLFSNLATSTPVMGVTLLAAMAAPVTYGTSLAIPVSIYTGQNYDAQDTKNKGTALSYALGMSALDLVGAKFGGLLLSKFKAKPALASQMATKSGRDKVSEFIANSANISKKEAEAILRDSVKEAGITAISNSKKLLEEMGGWASATGRVSAAGLKGMTSEGLTETMQEYLAIRAEANNISPEEMLNRLMNAGFAGGMLGGSFSMVGKGAEALNTRQGVVGLQETTTATATQNALDQDISEGTGSLLTEDQLTDVANLAVRTNKGGKDETANQSLGDQGAAEATGPTKGKVDRTINAVPGLVRGQIKHLLDKHQDGRFMSIIGSLLGANMARGNLSFEEAKRKRSAEYLGVAEFEGLMMSSNSEYNNIIDFSKALYGKQATIQEMFDRATNVNKKTNRANRKIKIESRKKSPISLSEINSSGNLGFSTAELRFLQQVYDKGSRAGPNVNLMNKVVSRNAVYKNQSEFEKILVDNTNLTPAEAAIAVSTFVKNTDYSSPLDVINNSSSDLGFLNPSVQAKTQATLENMPGAEKFLDDNIFNNVVNNANKFAAQEIENKYLGDGGSKLARLLDLAFDNGEITADEKAEIARGLKDYYDQLKGNYKRIDNKAYQSFVNNISFMTMLTALPLAAISSIVEIGYVLFQNNPKPMATALKMAQLSVKEMQATMNEGLTQLSNGRIPMKEYTHRAQIRSLGFMLDAQAPAARQGAELSPMQAMFGATFFKMSGLTGLTNLQRATRAAMADDAVNHWVDQLATHKGAGNKFEAEARDQLTNLGVDPEYFLERRMLHKAMLEQNMDPVKTREIFEDPDYINQLENAKLRFVDSAIAMPDVGNRPKFYNDSRYKLFTQFQGYISTATAVLLPVMYNNLGGKDKLPKARLQSLQTIASLLALSFLAQSMKDGAKMAFADDEAKERKEDYLTEWQKFIRAVYGSGVIGVLERPIDAIVPLYGERGTFTGNKLSKVFGQVVRTPVDTIISEAPGLSYVDSVFKAGESTMTGSSNAARNILKVTPYVAPFKDWFAPYIEE